MLIAIVGLLVVLLCHVASSQKVPRLPVVAVYAPNHVSCYEQLRAVVKNVRIDERTILDRVSEVANGDLLVAHVVVIKPAQLLQYFWMRRVELEGALVHILGKFKLYNQRETQR